MGQTIRGDRLGDDHSARLLELDNWLRCMGRTQKLEEPCKIVVFLNFRISCFQLSKRDVGISISPEGGNGLGEVRIPLFH